MARQLVPELSTPQGEPPDGTGTVEDTEPCPLCEFEAVDTSSIYIHLQTSHRKSRIARAVLADRSGTQPHRSSSQYR